MPFSDLLKRSCKPGGIQRALDFGDEAEMHGKGQGIEIEEPLATAERADKRQLPIPRCHHSKCPATRERPVVHCHQLSAAAADRELAVDSCIFRREALQLT